MLPMPALRTTRCKNSTHFPRVVYDQTTDEIARKKRTLQFMRDALNVKRKTYSSIATNKSELAIENMRHTFFFATDSLTARTNTR